MADIDPVGGMLSALINADIEFIVVGGTAAVLQGASVVTFDIDKDRAMLPVLIATLDERSKSKGRR